MRRASSGAGRSEVVRTEGIAEIDSASEDAHGSTPTPNRRIADRFRWERALAHRTGLPASVLDRVFAPQYVFRENTVDRSVPGYGFGWWVNQVRGRRFAAHTGITGTFYFRDLETGLSVIVLTSRDQPSGPGTMGIAHAVAQIVDPTTETDVWENDS